MFILNFIFYLFLKYLTLVKIDIFSIYAISIIYNKKFKIINIKKAHSSLMGIQEVSDSSSLSQTEVSSILKLLLLLICKYVKK